MGDEKIDTVAERLKGLTARARERLSLRAGDRVLPDVDGGACRHVESSHETVKREALRTTGAKGESESRLGVTVHVKVPVPSRYINELLRLRCARDWWPFLENSNAKEITESMAAFETLKRVIGHEAFGDSRWLALVPGDGKRARTGALVALRTAWHRVYSIDPGADGQSHGIQRLTIVDCKLEDWLSGWSGGAYPCCAVLAVHSHAPLKPLLSLRVSRLVVVALPCCVPQELPFRPALDREDRHVWSPKNRVIAWDLRNAGTGWISADTTVIDTESVLGDQGQ